MALRAEKLVNDGKQRRCGSAQPDGRSSSERRILTPDSDWKPGSRLAGTPEQEVKKDRKTPQAEQKKERMEEVKKKKEVVEQRQEPEGRQADETLTETSRKEVSVTR